MIYFYIDILFIVILSIIIFLHYKMYGMTVYLFFVFGSFFFVWLGFLTVKLDDSLIYFLHDSSSMIDNILPNAILFTCSLLIFSLLPHQKTANISQKIRLKYNLFNNKINKKWITFLEVTTFLLSIIILLKVKNISLAPIFHIFTSSPDKLSVLRHEFFNGVSSVMIYVLLYFMIPILLLIKGLNNNVRVLPIVPGFFLGVATLAKTFSIVTCAFYFLGKLFSSGVTYKRILKYLFVIIVVFVIIVKLKYLHDGRNIVDIIKVFYCRLIQVPVVLYSVYIEHLSFDYGFRSSKYYTYLFGGIKFDVSSYIGHIIAPNYSPPPQAPSGIIGSVSCNIPNMFIGIYYLIICLIIYIASFLTSLIREINIKIISTVFLGISSLFIYLTDPLTAFNSYGFLWLFLIVFSIKLRDLIKGFLG